MINSADPDQLASSEANWSGSTLFTKTVYPGSAGQGLSGAFFFFLFRENRQNGDKEFWASFPKVFQFH